MKNKYTFIILGFLAIAPVFMSNFGGSPGGRTGSPGDNSVTCATNGGCHGPKTPIDQEMISTDAGTNGYIPGDSLTITLSAARNGINKYGFEMIAEDTANNPQGTFANNSDINVLNGGIRATHQASSATGSGGSISWQMKWKAPDAGTGPLKFYVAVIAANNNGGNGGDNLLIDTLEIQENTMVGVNEINTLNLQVYPNPITDFVHISGELNDDATIEVFNTNMQSVLKKKASNVLDMRDLSSGSYLLKVNQDNRTFTKRVIKQ